MFQGLGRGRGVAVRGRGTAATRGRGLGRAKAAPKIMSDDDAKSKQLADEMAATVQALSRAETEQFANIVSTLAALFHCAMMLSLKESLVKIE